MRVNVFWRSSAGSASPVTMLSEMVSSAKADHALLNEAQQRAQLLLADYVNNIGQMADRHYTIEWVYLDANGTPTGETAVTETEAVSSAPGA